MSTHRPSLWRVLSDTASIIRAHSGHFLVLSALFLFPISIAACIYIFLLQPTSVYSHHRRFLFNVITPDSDRDVGKSHLLIQVLYYLSVYLFNLCAASSITYSTFLGFYGKPVNLISSLKSILVNFFPILATMLVIQIIMGLITFAYVIIMMLAYNGLALLGFEMSYDNDYFLVFVIAIAALLVGLLIYLQVEWCLVYGVVVLESKWGFAPLKRSSYLVKGMRGVVFSTLFFFGVMGSFSSIWYLSAVVNAGGGNGGWTGWLIVRMVVFAGFSTLLSLYGLAANTVLFLYCKESHGELAFQIHDEFSVEYVRLPSGGVNIV